jgi:hypothetical protein
MFGRLDNVRSYFKLFQVSSCYVKLCQVISDYDRLGQVRSGSVWLYQVN